MLIQSVALLLSIIITTINAASINPSLNQFARNTDVSLNNRIVGGGTATPGQFPHQVAIRLYGFIHACGGSIISANWVVTVAQCTQGWPMDLLAVFAGAHSMNDGVEYNLNTIIIHPEYVFDGYHELRNDISLVQTAESIVFSDMVAPISIHEGFVGAGKSVRFGGWGIIYLYGPSPDYLQYLDLITLTNVDCRSRHTSLTSGRVYDGTLCAYSMSIGEGICSGDIGSALVENDQLIGIASWKDDCALGRPDGFTRISVFLEWILETIS